MTPAINVRNLSFSYGQRSVLWNISFACSPRAPGTGEWIAILGPNGSGKSTLLKLLLGYLRPSSGEIQIGTQRLSELTPLQRAQQLALVPQQGISAGDGFSYSVREVVLMARHAFRARESLFRGFTFESTEDEAAAQTAMETMDVAGLADRPIDALSGGERQRVAVARALAQNTPIMLLDEPTSAMDLEHQFLLFDQLRALTQPPIGRTVILVTHDLHLAATKADRILLMDNGKLVADGPPQEILTPEHLEPVYRVRVSRESSGQLTFSRR